MYKNSMYYSTIKKNEVLGHAPTRMTLRLLHYIHRNRQVSGCGGLGLGDVEGGC